MNLLQKAINSIYPLENKTKNPFQMAVMNAFKNARQTVELSNNTAFACIERITAQANKLTPYIAYETSPDVFEYQPNNPLNYVLQRPNKYNLTWQSLLSQIIQSYYDTGNVLLYAPESTIKGAIGELVLLNWDRITVKMSKSGTEVIGYEYQTSSGSVVYPADKCIHIKDLRNNKTDMSLQYLVGTPSYRNALKNLLQVEAELMEFYNRLFETDALDVIALMSEQQITPDILTRIKDRFQQMFGKNFVKQVFALEQGMKLETISRNSSLSSSLAGNNLTEVVQKQICAIFNVPYPIYNGEFSGVVNNSSIMLQSFYDSVDTIVVAFEQYFTDYFRKFDIKAIVMHDKVRAEDIKTKSETLTLAFNRGQLTINQMNEMLGYPIVNETFANTHFMPFGYEPVKNLVAPQVVESKSYSLPVVTKSAESDFDIIWKALDEPYQKNKKRFEKEIAYTFGLIEEVVLKEVDSATKQKSFLDGNTDIFNVEFFQKLLAKNTLNTRTRIAIEAIIIALNDMNLSVDNVQDEYDKILARTIRESAIRLGESVETLNKELKELVSKTVASTGVSDPEKLKTELQTSIAKQFDIYTTSRSTMIAQTTTTNLVNNNYKEAHKRNNFDSQWVSQRDGKRVRPAHQDADGKVSDEDGMFEVGKELMPYPAGGRIASNNINCRCYIKSKKRKQ